jgi:filamentous hemagglutinin
MEKLDGVSAAVAGGMVPAPRILGTLGMVEGRVVPSSASLAAGEVRFSQSTVSFQKLDRNTGQAFTYDDLVSSMTTQG